MHDHKRCRPALLALATTLVTSPVAGALPAFDLVASTRQQAPGTSPGTTFGLFSNPMMNASGQVIFRATLQNAPAAADTGIWLSDALVALEGTPAPGDGGIDLYFGGLSDTFPAVVNDDGVVAFASRPILYEYELGSNDRAVWAGKPGDLRLVALSGTHAPGLGHDAIFRIGDGSLSTQPSPYAPHLSDSGQIAFWAEVADTDGRYDAIYAGPYDSPTFRVRGRHQAHDLPPGGHHAFFGRFILIDGAGNALFSSVLEGNGVSQTDNDATYLATPTGVRRARRENDPITAIPGARWGVASGLSTLNESGQTIFSNVLRGVPAGTERTLWYGDPLNPSLVARAGQPVPGAPQYRFTNSFDSPFIDDSGRVAFLAPAAPLDSTATGTVGLWTGAPGDFDLVAFERTQAPGLPDGVLFNQFDRVAVNANGLLLFTSTLRGDGVTAQSDNALFAGTPGDLHLLVREGDLFEVAPGDVRKVLLFQFPSASYLEHQINDADQVLVTIRFTDLTDVIYRVTVPIPEPAMLSLLALPTLLLRRRRSRRGRTSCSPFPQHSLDVSCGGSAA